MGILYKIDLEVKKNYPNLKDTVDSKVVQEIIEAIVGEGTKLDFVKGYLKDKGYLYIDIPNIQVEMNNKRIKKRTYLEEIELNSHKDRDKEEFDLDLFFESSVFKKAMTATEKIKDFTDNHELFEKLLSEQSEVKKHEIIVANLPLVNKVASKYAGITNGAMDYDDLVSEGTFGLMKAVDRYNVQLGYEFSTYAYYWIKQTITRAIADKSLAIRLPVHLHETLNKINKAERESWRGMEKVNAEEIARICGISVEKYEYLKMIEYSFRHSSSINTPLKENGEEDILTMIGRESSIWLDNERDETDPFQVTEKIILNEEIEKILTMLSEREQYVLRLRFGLDDDQTKTLEEIGSIIGVTRERIRQIEAKALKKLTSPSMQRGFKEFILN